MSQSTTIVTSKSICKLEKDLFHIKQIDLCRSFKFKMYKTLSIVGMSNGNHEMHVMK